MRSAVQQHLLIDADDTLWENNVFFEQAFDEFVEYLNHSSLSGPEVRAVLDEIELANIKIHGYGAANFGRNLRECYQKLAEREYAEADLKRIMALAERILDHPMELIEGVEDTLAYLAGRHELTLFTKGHPEEQKLKIDRSGLAAYFGHTAIVREKDAAAYSGLAAERSLDTARTWMVGNSPKSDINPALAAGLRAVFIPHARTWGLEKEAVPENHERLLVLESFEELKEHF
jgi:putative hydrolase of the HAD superfamily